MDEAVSEVVEVCYVNDSDYRIVVVTLVKTRIIVLFVNDDCRFDNVPVVGSTNHDARGDEGEAAWLTRCHRSFRRRRFSRWRGRLLSEEFLGKDELLLQGNVVGLVGKYAENIEACCQGTKAAERLAANNGQRTVMRAASIGIESMYCNLWCVWSSGPEPSALPRDDNKLMHRLRD